MFKKLLFVVLFDMTFAGAFLSCFQYLFALINRNGMAVHESLMLMILGPYAVFKAYTFFLYFVIFLPALWFSRRKPLKMRASMRILAYVTWLIFWYHFMGIGRFGGMVWIPISVSGLLSTALSEPLWDYVVTKRAERRARRGKGVVQDA